MDSQTPSTNALKNPVGYGFVSDVMKPLIGHACLYVERAIDIEMGTPAYVVPATVTAVHGSGGCVNLRVLLNGEWVPRSSVSYSVTGGQGTWHRAFEGKC